MAFSFGSTGQSAFGTTQNKPTAFGTPFGPTTTTTTSGFGGFGSTFGGSVSQQQPTFGSTFGQQSAAPAFGQPSAAPAFGQQTTTPAFGQQSITPAFGQQSTAPAFGQQSTAPAFGQSTTPAFGSTFGQPASTTPAFGQSGTAPAFGSTFGAPATSAPTFGTTFGNPATSTPSLFGSIQTSKPSFFGTPSSTTPSLFGTTTTTTGGGLFGSTTSGGLFGATTTTQAPSLFGATTTTTPSLFSSVSSTPSLFGTTSQPSTGGLFGTTTTTQPSLFGATTTPQFGLGLGTTTTSSGFNLFGSTTTTTAPSLFGGFGTATTTQSSFGGFGCTYPGFGATPSTSSIFAKSLPTAPVPAAQPPIDKNQQILASIYAINVFGDERDNVLKKWNMLQACWGTGKGYYNQSQPPVEYDNTNPFYRFKAMGYIVTPDTENSEGLVKLIFSKKLSELREQKEVLIKGLSSILGNKPNLTVAVDSMKPKGDNRTDVVIMVTEKGATGQSRKIPATELAAFLSQPMTKQQLTNVGVTLIVPLTQLTKAQIEEYLRNPGPGIDPAMWQTAQMDNPDPKKFLPVPINGFTDLKKRMLEQEYETGLHRAFIEKVTREIEVVKSKHIASMAQIAEMKQKLLALQHRTLRILVKQECTRKVGMALQPEEEMLRARLETMHAQLGVPNQYRGLLNELLSHVKLNGGFAVRKENYKVDNSALDDIKQFLKLQQNGISQLVKIINSDLKALKIINEGLQDLSKYQLRM